MERLRGLGRYQIALLVCGVVMILVFSVLYPVTTARVGFLYQDTILTPAQEGDTTVYSGKLRGEAARFTVHADKSVEFQYGDKTYGPYTVTEDPDARPDSELSRYLTGVEVRCGDTILFRGGVMENGGETLLYHEDGSIDLDLPITAITSSGVTLDGNGNEVDPMELSVRTILELTEGPELQHKGGLDRVVRRCVRLRRDRVFDPVCGRAVPLGPVFPGPRRGAGRALRLGDRQPLHRLDRLPDPGPGHLHQGPRGGIRQHRTIASARFGGSFPPILRFSNLGLTKNLSPNLLAELCGAAIRKTAGEQLLSGCFVCVGCGVRGCWCSP